MRKRSGLAHVSLNKQHFYFIENFFPRSKYQRLSHTNSCDFNGT